MVVAQGHHLLVHRGHRAGVPGIGAVDELRGDEHDVGGAAGMRGFVVGRPILPLFHLFLNTDYLILPILAEEQLIHFQECLLECLLVIPLLEILVGFKFDGEVAFNKGRAFRTYILI